MSLSGTNMLAGLIFGTIGFSAFIYGKKQSAWKPMVLGAVLMGFPYFVADTIAQYIVGAVLIFMLFILR